ncbi:putative oligopeptide transporter, OPT superfamily [Dioscorea sansibarensis]
MVLVANSITAQQIGSRSHGLVVGSFGLDWSTISTFPGSPLATPAYSIFNLLVGYVLIIYVLLPIIYWINVFDAKKFPIISSQVYDSTGHKYNITSIMNLETLAIDYDTYNSYSKINLSVFFSFHYELSFATLMATLTHVFLYHGKIMKRNYDIVPQWWFVAILDVTLALSYFACEGFNRQL